MIGSQEDRTMRERRNVNGMAFRNLHHKGVVYSFRNAEGKTILHSENILVRDAKFVVQPGGRARVLALKKKTVHAGVKGELLVDPVTSAQLLPEVLASSITAYYNPYKTDSFLSPDGRVLEGADLVLLTNTDNKQAKVLVVGPKYRAA